MRLSTLLVFTCRKIQAGRSNRRLLHEKIWNGEHTVVTEASIKDKLTSYSIPFIDGYACFLVKDCLCRNTGNHYEKGDIFINKRTGLFLCEQCKVTGEWDACSNLLKKDRDNPRGAKFNTEILDRYDKEVSNWNEVSEETTLLKSLSTGDYEEVLREFSIRDCSKATADRLKIRINKERDLLYFPLFCLDSPVVGYKAYSKDGTEKTFPRMDCPGFLLHSNKSNQAVVVVSNIPDFLVLVSQNLDEYDIACLQYGSSYLPQMTLPFFEKYKKIFLWLGEKSLEATGNLARKFNEKRCYVVRSVERRLTPSIALTENEDFQDILSEAKLAWHKYVTTFGSLREEVLAQLLHVEEVVGVPWKRFPKLTKILKGHRRGEVTVLTGPTGVGKTTFLSEYSLDLAMQGVNTLWGSFEIKNSRLAKMLLTQFAREPLPTNLKDYNALCDRFEELPIFFLNFHGHQELSTVMEAVTHCFYTYDISHVIIDNIQFVIEVSGEANPLDRFWKQDYMIQMFRKFATANNCHVTLVMHPKKIEGFDLSVNSIFGGVKASQEADNILIIQKKEVNSFLVRKFLQVSKNRYDGDLGTFPLHFEKTSLCFSKTNEDGAGEAKIPPDIECPPWPKMPEEEEY